MHEAVVMTCVLGCPEGKDTLEHYLGCDRFWRLVHGTSPRTKGTGPRSVLGRLGLVPLSSAAWKDLVVAFRFYHNLKHSGNLRGSLDIRALAGVCKRVMQAVRFSTADMY